MNSAPVTPILEQVLAHYPPAIRSCDIRPFASAGGFSGAHLWRFSTFAGDFCLRRWPREHPKAARLAWIHSVLRQAGQRGIAYVPVPLLTTVGESFVSIAGEHWQVEPWMPGASDFHQAPSAARLENCLKAVARFHHAVAIPRAASFSHQVSPGILERRDLVRMLLQNGIARLNMAMKRDVWPDVFDRGVELLALFPMVAPAVAGRLEIAMRFAVPLQPCIRDLWHDHVLFSGDEVTGLIDFGAMREDNVATDLARLLGSLVRDEDASWEAALQAYSQIRPLSGDERELVKTFDQSSTLLSGIHWLKWIFVDRKQFEQPGRVLERMDEHLSRLRRLSSQSLTF